MQRVDSPFRVLIFLIEPGHVSVIDICARDSYVFTDSYRVEMMKISVDNDCRVGCLLSSSDKQNLLFFVGFSTVSTCALSAFQ